MKTPSAEPQGVCGHDGGIGIGTLAPRREGGSRAGRNGVAQPFGPRRACDGGLASSSSAFCRAISAALIAGMASVSGRLLSAGSGLSAEPPAALPSPEPFAAVGTAAARTLVYLCCSTSQIVLSSLRLPPGCVDTSPDHRLPRDRPCAGADLSVLLCHQPQQHRC